MKKLSFFLPFFLFYAVFVVGQLRAQGGQWTVVATYPIPEGAAGLAYDGTYLYCGIYGSNGDEVYQINPADGSYQLLFSNPNIGDTYGMTYNGQHLWITDHVLSISTPATAIELDFQGNIVSQFDLPAHYMSGIAYDSGTFWVARYYPDPSQIYQVDSTGAVLGQFTAPDNQPWDLCLENGNLWMADYWGDALYKLDPTTGTLLETHASEGSDPAGIVWDGQYLWYCDNGQGYQQDYLYKVDLSGTGTPVLVLGFTEHDFGNVVMGQPATVELNVFNSGTGALVLQDLQFTSPEFATTHVLPDTIPAGSQVNVTLTFTPSSWGYYESLLTVTTNDPVTPQATVTLSGYGIAPLPEIVVEPGFVEFDAVRVGALTGRWLTVSNQGDQDLTMTEITVDDSRYWVEATLPLTLSTRDSASFRVWFQPFAAGQVTATLTITSNDPDEPLLAVPLYADVIYYSTTMGTQLWSFQTNVQQEKVVAIRCYIDLNNDGVEEILVADNRYHVYCLNGNSSGSADVLWVFNSAIPNIGTGSIYHEQGMTVAGDLNGDGVADVVVGTAWGSRAVFALNGANGSILWYYDTHVTGGGGWVYQIDAQRDFTGDGITDVLACAGDDSYGTGPKRVYLFDGTNGSLLWEHAFSAAMSSVVSVEDVTGDGVPETACGESSNTGTAHVYLLDGANGNILFTRPTTSSAVYALTTIQDITGDGLMDICYGDFSGNLRAVGTNNQEVWTYSMGLGLITTLVRVTTSNGDDYLLPSILGNTQLPFLQATDGTARWTTDAGGYILDASPVEDLDGDAFPEVVVGTLSHLLTLFSGNDGQLLYSVDLSTPVDQTNGGPDVDASGAPEFLAGTRDGWVYCLSGGGTIATDYPPVISQVHIDPPQPTTGDSVNVLATVTDDLGLGTVQAFWGLDSSTFLPLTMTPTGPPDEYGTSSPIPPQLVGTTVYYYVYASDGTHTVTSPLATYTTAALGGNDDKNLLPLRYTLRQNYPNPFNPITTIPFDLPEPSVVTLALYDLMGREVRVLIRGEVPAGFQRVPWEGTDNRGNPLSSGVYLVKFFARSQTSDKTYTQTRKLVLLK